jgi:hypothetical protein
MICGVVATSISGCGVCTACRVVCDCSRTLHGTHGKVVSSVLTLQANIPPEQTHDKFTSLQAEYSWLLSYSTHYTERNATVNCDRPSTQQTAALVKRGRNQQKRKDGSHFESVPLFLSWKVLTAIIHVLASRATIYFCNHSITGVSCLPKWKCNKLLTRRIIASHKKKSNAMESGRDLINITKPQSVK